jgi:transposase
MALARLRRHGEHGDLPVIIEKISGQIVDRLLAAGHPVVPVHPNSFHAARPGGGASGAKSDPGDSYKLADYLRTDGHRLRRLEPADSGLRELQARSPSATPSSPSPTTCCPTLMPATPTSAPSGTTASPRSGANASSSPSWNACPA